jgi:transcriptional regulator with XRE-family HTH domain
MTTRRPLTAEERQDAERLRRLWNARREDLHLSQVKAAEEMGFASQAAVSQYLNARVPLNMSAVAKFAQLLHTKIEEISPRYAKLAGEPIPSELSGFKAPQTGSLGGVDTTQCLDWFAFSEGFLRTVGAKALKLFRLDSDANPEFARDTVMLVDDSDAAPSAPGVYLMQSGGEIVANRVRIEGELVYIEGAVKMAVDRTALPMLRILARVVAQFKPL